MKPAVASPGSTIALLLANGTQKQIGYNLCDSTLEQWHGEFWRQVAQDIVCTQELRIISPG